MNDSNSYRGIFLLDTIGRWQIEITQLVGKLEWFQFNLHGGTLTYTVKNGIWTLIQDANDQKMPMERPSNESWGTRFERKASTFQLDLPEHTWSGCLKLKLMEQDTNGEWVLRRIECTGMIYWCFARAPNKS